MDASKVRQIVREEIQRSMGSSGTQISGGLGSAVQREIQRSNNASRFAVNNIPQHTHDGINSPKVKAENVVPAASIMGTVTFDAVASYRINLNAFFTPRHISATGILTGTSQITSQTARVTTNGFALLTPSFYLEENDPDPSDVIPAKVVIDTLDLEFPFNGKPAQGSSYLWAAKSGSNNEAFAGISRDHIVSVYTDPDDDTTIRARATVTEFGNNFVVIDVPILVSGWKIILNLVIT